KHPEPARADRADHRAFRPAAAPPVPAGPARRPALLRLRLPPFHRIHRLAPRGLSGGRPHPPQRVDRSAARSLRTRREDRMSLRILMTADTLGGVWTYAQDLCRALLYAGAE